MYRAVNQGIFKGKKIPASSSKSEQASSDLATSTDNAKLLKKEKKKSALEYISPVGRKEDVPESSTIQSTSRVTRASSRKLESEANTVHKDLSLSFERTQPSAIEIKKSGGYHNTILISLLLISAAIVSGITFQYHDIDTFRNLLKY